MAKKQKKIQDFDGLYWFLRYYVDLGLKLSYRHIRYVGRERIPKNGAVIYAPNHTNALMDALVILAMDRKPKVFVARADIFKKPLLAKIFAFLKIMPIMRMRDGIEEVKKNNETIERAVDVLRDRIPFCIFPEGTHQTKYSTLPLSKGIFRIAFQAQELMPDLPLYIVPVGLRYGSFFRFRSTVRVQIGDPISVGEYISTHPNENRQEQMNGIKDLLTSRLQSSILYIPDDDDYEATYEICAATVKQHARQLRKSANKRLSKADAHFEANNLTVKTIQTLKELHPKKAKELLDLGRQAAMLRQKEEISLASVSLQSPMRARILKQLLLLISLPYTIPASLCSLPLYGVCRLLFSRLKDPAFRNSVRYLVNLLLWPLLMLLYAIIAYSVLPWHWALPLTLALLPAPILAQECWRLLRLFVSDAKLQTNKQLRGIYNQIRSLLFTTEQL